MELQYYDDVFDLDFSNVYIDCSYACTASHLIRLKDVFKHTFDFQQLSEPSQHSCRRTIWFKNSWSPLDDKRTD